MHACTHTHSPRSIFTRYSRLSIRSGLTTVLNEQPLFVQPAVKPNCTTGLRTGCIHDTASCQTGCITGWLFVYTIQPVVKPVWQPVCIVYTNIQPVVIPVWQQVVSCKRGLTVVHWCDGYHPRPTSSISSTLVKPHNIWQTAYLQSLQLAADARWGQLTRRGTRCQKLEPNSENVFSATPVYPPGTGVRKSNKN